MSRSSDHHRPRRLPFLVRAVLRSLTPFAEREELLADLQSEFEERARRDGRTAAHGWIWRQTLSSAPPLLRRTWWRGMTGFEARANRMRPGGPAIEGWLIDFRYAARRLRSRPAYTALAALTISLGVAGTSAIFGVARTLLLDPLPIEREEQVGVLWFQLSWSEEEFLGLRPDFPGFRQMAAYRPSGVTLEEPGGTLLAIPGYAVSSELFDVLGAPPMLGRTFRPGEDLVGAEPVAVLSYALWEDLGADPNIVGAPLRLGELTHMVVGVMPPSFWFPNPTTQIWTAARMSPQNGGGFYSLVGRLAEGQSIDSMEIPLQVLTGLLARNFEYPIPQWDKTRNASVVPVRDFFVGDVQAGLLATLVAMGIILLIACANVTSLILGKVDARAPEIAIRSALGANRHRLIRQLVIESLVIGFLAGVAGAALAAGGFQVFVALLPLDELGRTVQLDWTVFWTALLSSLVAALLVSITPGIRLWWREGLRSRLSTARTDGVGAHNDRFGSGLVVAQMALVVLLVMGAGLLIRSVANLRAIDPGLQVDGVAVVDAGIPGGIAAEVRRNAVQAMLGTLHALPGVTEAAAAQKLPLRGSGDNWGLSILGKPPLNASTAVRIVTANYFTTMGIPIQRGRDFGPDDRPGSRRVVIVNEALADEFFPGEDPIGQVLQTVDEAGERIVGVVANTLEAGLTDGPAPARYMLYDQVPGTQSRVSFVMRTDNPGGLTALLVAARSTIAGKGSLFAVDQTPETTTMKQIRDRAMGPVRQLVTLLSLVGGLALVLGAIGVYGVIRHFVLRHSREYGIRIALGEQPSHVLRRVVLRGAVPVAAGAAIGILAALAVTRMLSSLLYEVRPTDPLVMLCAVMTLLLVGMAAAYLPGRRASRTDPATILRHD